jgi:UrcA family protein
MMKTLMAATVSLACLAPAALAADPDRQVETVRFNATDLHNPNAVAEIRAELRDAADRLCQQRALRGLDRVRAERNCVEILLEEADFRLDQRIAEVSTQRPRMAFTLVRPQ